MFLELPDYGVYKFSGKMKNWSKSKKSKVYSLQKSGFLVEKTILLKICIPHIWAILRTFEKIHFSF